MYHWTAYFALGQLIFGALAITAGVYSAGYWYQASQVPIPPHTGDSWAGDGPFRQSLLTQSDLNRKAAIAAALAVFAQQVSFVASYIAQMHLP
jgi:hypothetical protein